MQCSALVGFHDLVHGTPKGTPVFCIRADTTNQQYRHIQLTLID